MAHVPPKAEALSMCLKPGVNIALVHTELVYFPHSHPHMLVKAGRGRVRRMTFWGSACDLIEVFASLSSKDVRHYSRRS